MYISQSGIDERTVANLEMDNFNSNPILKPMLLHLVSNIQEFKELISFKRKVNN